MTVIAAYFDKKGRIPDQIVIEQMMGGICFVQNYRVSIVTNNGIGLGFLRPEYQQKNEYLYHDLVTGLYVIFCGRIDNKNEFAQDLGIGSQIPGSAELIATAYQSSGEYVFPSIYGDFSFVIYNPGRSILAVRDALGVSPLYFHEDAEGIAIASDISQLLALSDVMINDHAIMELLTDTYSDTRRTYFKKIYRVRPGHYISGSPAGVSEKRYWFPPLTPSETMAEEEVFCMFRALLSQSVEKRLEESKRAIIQLSGGLDSSAIAVLAHQYIGRERSSERRNFYLFSARYPEVGCDEFEYFDAVRRQLTMPAIEWTPKTSGWVTQEHFIPATPVMTWASDIQAGICESVDSTGSDTVLSGLGGDELLFETGCVKDLWQVRQLTAIIQEVWSLSDGAENRLSFALRRLLSVIAPVSLRKLYGKYRKDGTKESRDWLQPRLAELSEHSDKDLLENLKFHSYTQAATWARLNGPRMIDSLELLQSIALRKGYKFSFPFLDRRLVEFVLQLPFTRRLSHGTPKRILRESLRGLLPEKVISRKGISDYTPLYVWQVEDNINKFKELIRGAAWSIESYVSRKVANRLLREVEVSNTIGYGEAARLRSLAEFDYWFNHFNILRKGGVQ